MRRSAIALSSILALLCLGACEKSGPPPTPLEVSLVGMSQAKLTQCAGQPASSVPADGLDYLTYSRSEVLDAGLLQNANVPLVGSLAIGTKGVQVTCEATVILKAGKVEALGLRTYPQQGETLAVRICKPIFSRCLNG
ncbi:MAG TPA: hypothetical protein VMF53_11825 [Alphaproteobacteria bacterium]|nr:hypothetical protein [Alphaproteobacteria bacterium]